MRIAVTGREGQVVQSLIERAARDGSNDIIIPLGRPDLGTLAPGSKADMMAVSLDDPAFVPLLDDAMLIEHLVWSASSRLVTDVWVGGDQVVAAKQHHTIDLDRAQDEVGRRAARLVAAAD